jgi:hypothetical protein
MVFGLVPHTQERPPQILQIHRDFLRSGSEAAYAKIEQDAARVCAGLGCPHPYLAIESVSGPKEVWFFNGYVSAAEQKQTGDAYAKNPTLVAALNEIVASKKDLLESESVNVFTDYREQLSSGTTWIMGHGHFLVITVTQSKSEIEGTVFEAEDGTRFIVRSTRTRNHADTEAVAAGSETRVFAVRPDWSLPAAEWIAADRPFWAGRKASGTK